MYRDQYSLNLVTGAVLLGCLVAVRADTVLTVQSYQLPGQAPVPVEKTDNDHYDLPATSTVTLKCERQGGTAVFIYPTLDSMKVRLLSVY